MYQNGVRQCGNFLLTVLPIGGLWNRDHAWKPSHEKILKVFKLDFLVSNNEAKYEVLLIGLWMTKDLDVKFIQVICYSKLETSQINSKFESREHEWCRIYNRQKIWWLILIHLKSLISPANSEANRLAWIDSGIDWNPTYPMEKL